MVGNLLISVDVAWLMISWFELLTFLVIQRACVVPPYYLHIHLLKEFSILYLQRMGLRYHHFICAWALYREASYDVIGSFSKIYSMIETDWRINLFLLTVS
jgi:hypothetical protein